MLTGRSPALFPSHSFRAVYKAGCIMENIKPVAGRVGTTILVEDLFYNAPLRKRALTNAAEEHKRTKSILAAYAVDNPSVSFTLKKVSDSNLLIPTH